jgi:acyl-CoA thioesterase I
VAAHPVRLLPLLALLPLLGPLVAACAAPPVAADPPAEPRTVVTLGDSVPAGTACDCDPFPTLYARAQNATDINLAASGSTATDLRVAVPADRDVLSTATEVVIMTGANDVAASFDPSDTTDYADAAAGVRTDVAASIAAIQQIHHVPVIVLGYWNVVLDGQVAAEEYGADGVRQAAEATTAINNALKAAAAQSGATFIDTYAAFHGPTGSKDPTTLLASDGDHPNAAGHAAIAALLPSLSEAPLSAQKAPPAAAHNPD